MSLQTLTLFTPLGGLVEANAVRVEFSDLLKRPLELNNYLLQVALDNTSLYVSESAPALPELPEPLETTRALS